MIGFEAQSQRAASLNLRQQAFQQQLAAAQEREKKKMLLMALLQQRAQQRQAKRAERGQGSGMGSLVGGGAGMGLGALASILIPGSGGLMAMSALGGGLGSKAGGMFDKNPQQGPGIMSLLSQFGQMNQQQEQHDLAMGQGVEDVSDF
jgi:hypothetical protein